MYAGVDSRCAFIETFGDARDDQHRMVVAWSDLGDECLWRQTFLRPVRVVDLSAEGLQSIGADGRLCSGDDYGLCQRWSAAIHDHRSKPDGIVYRARHDQSRVSLALYDRLGAAVIREESIGSLTAPENLLLLGEIVEAYDFAILP